MSAQFQFSGTCHCGGIRGTLAASRPAAELQLRSCQCGFCTRHGAITVSDPAGRATFEIDRGALGRYQFETRTGTTLLCARCGMYVGVVLEDEGKTWSVINVRGLAVPEFAGRAGELIVYEGETPAQRIARRKVKWTPTELRLIG